MRIRGIINKTEVNGPGVRTGIWTQGCTVACPGCVNPETWQKDGPGSREISTEELFKVISLNKKDYDISGVTFSGGEPLEQLEALKEILVEIKSKTDLDVLVYSGRLISDIKDYSILNYVDVFVDGPYLQKEHNLDLLWRGSSNQRVFILNDKMRDKMKNFYNLLDEDGNLLDQETGCEMTIDENGEVQLTGFSDMSERKLKREI